MFPRVYFRTSPKIKKYLRDNPGALFVIGFQLLLVICAGLLIQGSVSIANDVAMYAYLMLVVGAVLQFIAYVKHRSDDEEENYDGR